MKKAATIISILFHPLIIPTIGIYILFHTNSYLNYALPEEMKMAIIYLIGFATFIVPLILSLLMLSLKIISSLEMEKKEERVVPYIVTIGTYIATLYYLKLIHISPIISKFIVATTISIILAFIINFRWKISAHMIGIGGLLGVLITVSILLQVYMLPIIVLTFIASGLLGSSRLILNAHTPAQIYVGFILGFLCQFGIIYF